MLGPLFPLFVIFGTVDTPSPPPPLFKSAPADWSPLTHAHARLTAAQVVEYHAGAAGEVRQGPRSRQVWHRADPARHAIGKPGVSQQCPFSLVPLPICGGLATAVFWPAAVPVWGLARRERQSVILKAAASSQNRHFSLRWRLRLSRGPLQPVSIAGRGIGAAVAVECDRPAGVQKGV